MSANSEKIAVITGASSGIGLASAQALAKAGYSLLLVARDHEKLSGATSAIKLESEGHIVQFQCDVSDPSQVRNLSEFASANFKHIDLLFNNAGAGQSLSLENTSDEVWSNIIGVNLAGTFFCCRELLPLLKAAEHAVIINNASSAAHIGFPNFSAYSAAKGGVVALSRSLREELRPTGIRVTTLSAGATDTAFWDNLEGEWDRSRMMTCDSVGELVLYIASMPACAQLEEMLLMPAGGAL